MCIPDHPDRVAPDGARDGLVLKTVSINISLHWSWGGSRPDFLLPPPFPPLKKSPSCSCSCLCSLLHKPSPTTKEFPSVPKDTLSRGQAKRDVISAPCAVRNWGPATKGETMTLYLSEDHWGWVRLHFVAALRDRPSRLAPRRYRTGD